MTACRRTQPESRVARVDATRPRATMYRAWARFTATTVGLWLSEHVSWKIDPWLLRRTRGRLSLAWPIRVVLLETTGAKTGLPRAHAVIYFTDDDAVVIVASFRGEPRHPGWFHNLVGDPHVRVNGVPHRASVVEDPSELARLWPLADRVFPPYAAFRARAARASGRVIPIVRLLPI
jgi:deazaflavin-dependent oxidoreductase (nitroreductase family)